MAMSYRRIPVMVVLSVIALLSGMTVVSIYPAAPRRLRRFLVVFTRVPSMA
jgi:hypothetical protein